MGFENAQRVSFENEEQNMRVCREWFIIFSIIFDDGSCIVKNFSFLQPSPFF